MKDVRIRGNDHFATIVQAAPVLGQLQRRMVAKAIENAAAEFGTDELGYVRAKILKKIELAAGSTTKWVQDMADGFRRLYSWFEFQLSHEENLADDSVRLVGATLFYFINIFDVIPDHTVGIGFSDDALALHLCARQLPSGWIRVHS